MNSFLTGANLVWIFTILSSLIAGLNALRKYRYEKKLEQFKDTNIDLFKQEKEIVLAAISTLSIFKKDPSFKQHTTNVLLSRLYTELDYDITNAICSTLIQYSNRDELLDISSEVLNINRNFYVQTLPLQQRIGGLDKIWGELNMSTEQADKEVLPPPATDNNAITTQQNTAVKSNDPLTPESILQIEKRMAKELMENYCKASLTYLPKSKYELSWHKQITADTYSRILRRANYADRHSSNRLWQRYFRLSKNNNNRHSHNGLDMDFYQNDFNYVYMADFSTSSCSILRSAISWAALVDVSFNNINRIIGTFFTGTAFYDCHFRGGVIENQTDFTYCKFQKGSFEHIIINKINFSSASFDDFLFQGSFLNKNQFSIQLNQSAFNLNRFSNCILKNCIISRSTFDKAFFYNCTLDNVVFESIVFTATCFFYCTFSNVQFVDCFGLSPWQFYGYQSIDNRTRLPEGIAINTVNALLKEDVISHIKESAFEKQDEEMLENMLA